MMSARLVGALILLENTRTLSSATWARCCGCLIGSVKDFDLAPKPLAKLQLERDHTDQVHLGRRVKLGDKVDIAVGPGLAARTRTEQGERANIGFPQGGLVRPQDRQ